MDITRIKFFFVDGFLLIHKVFIGIFVFHMMIRKLETKTESQKKEKKKQWVLAIILGVILFGSTFGIIIDSFGNQSTKVKYNGNNFENIGGYWVTQINGLNLVMVNNPKQTESIQSKINTLQNYYSKPLYIYSENVEAETEIYNNLAPQFNAVVERIQKACPQNKNCSDSIPKKSCTDNFIIIEYSNSSTLRQENNCVYIQGTPENILKIVDEFLLKLMGIKE